MKRGQLAAVLVIVLLVAAVAGLVVFSAKKAGKSTFTLAPQQTYTQPVTYEQPTQNQQPPGGTTASGGTMAKESIICGTYETTIHCGCGARRVIKGKCGSMSPDFSYGGLGKATFSISADGRWTCSVSSKLFDYWIKVKGDICDDKFLADQRGECIKNARTNGECKSITKPDDYVMRTLDSMVKDCAAAANKACMSSVFAGMNKPVWSKYAGVIPDDEHPEGNMGDYSDVMMT